VQPPQAVRGRELASSCRCAALCCCLTAAQSRTATTSMYEAKLHVLRNSVCMLYVSSDEAYHEHCIAITTLQVARLVGLSSPRQKLPTPQDRTEGISRQCMRRI
jgi:hypothetical protein